MASKKKLKVRIKQLREVAKCERTERLALDRHCDSLLTLFNEECARNEKLKAELTLYEDRDNDRWMSYCHGWENGRSTAFDSRLTVGHTILKTWTDREKEALRQRLAWRPDCENGGWERLVQFGTVAKHREEHPEDYPLKCQGCKCMFTVEEYSSEFGCCLNCEFDAKSRREFYKLADWKKAHKANVDQWIKENVSYPLRVLADMD